MDSIPPYALRLEPLNDLAASMAGFRYADPDIGHRHRIGGEAPVEPPSCTSCGEIMTFYGQLDSIGDEICLADVGLIAVFVCFGCFQADASVISS